MTADHVRRAVDKAAADRRTGDVLWRVRSDDGELDVTYGDPARPFFLASATKLATSAILAQLRVEGRVDWDEPVAPLLPDLDLTGLSVDRGRDRSRETTVRELLAHTSGIADYFEGRRKGQPTTFDRVTEEDMGWTVSDVVGWTRDLAPGTPGRGLYSDTGYQLLGALIERIDGTTYADAVRRRIVEPLGLADTYVFGEETAGRYDEITPLRLGDRLLRIPGAMASVQADGGMVSTLRDGMSFLDAFFDGRLVAPEILDEMQQGWHPIFFPLEYGTGLMRFRVRRYFSPVVRVPPFVGHSGASGVVMFRCPELGLSIVGTVSQIERRSLPYQLMVRSVIAAGRR
jgi:CubicO group peptidase (beta-lactamase class C family)